MSEKVRFPTVIMPGSRAEKNFIAIKRFMEESYEKTGAHVVFKSDPQHFTKEISGRKPNTVREVDRKDIRFQILKMISRLGPGHGCKVGIQNTETREIFVRPITDIDYWKDLTVISWEHQTLLGVVQ